MLRVISNRPALRQTPHVVSCPSAKSHVLFHFFAQKPHCISRRKSTAQMLMAMRSVTSDIFEVFWHIELRHLAMALANRPCWLKECVAFGKIGPLDGK